MAFHCTIRHRRLTASIMALPLGLACGMASAPALAVDHPDLFQVTSPDFADGGMLKAENAGTGTSPRGPWACGGADVSPSLVWSHAPAGTESFAVVMDDPDAASGRGGTHWIMYDIASSVASWGATPRTILAISLPAIQGMEKPIPGRVPNRAPRRIISLSWSMRSTSHRACCRPG